MFAFIPNAAMILWNEEIAAQEHVLQFKAVLKMTSLRRTSG